MSKHPNLEHTGPWLYVFKVVFTIKKTMMSQVFSLGQNE